MMEERVMKIFKNLKIAQKLILCFLLIAIIMGVVGFIGISEIRKINANSNSMYEDNLIHLREVGELKENFLTKCIVRNGKHQLTNEEKEKYIIPYYNKLVNEIIPKVNNFYKNTMIMP